MAVSMMCEMCGKDVEMLNRVHIEGTILRLCTNCARFGTIVEPVLAGHAASGKLPVGSIDGRLADRARRMEERDLYRELPEMELAADWPKRVQAARQRLGWTPEEFGKKLNEKKSVVLKIEAGAFRPPDIQIRKIENLLKVRLRAAPQDDG